MYESIKTPRLVLRPLQTGDAKDFAQLVNVWEICRMTGSFPYPFPRISVEGRVDIFVARAATGRAFHWAITLEGQFIGAVGLYRKGSDWDIGYWIGQPYWEKGLTGEAVSALVSHIMSHQPETRIHACVFTDNPASAKLLKRIGFVQHDGVCKGYSLARQGMQDKWTFHYSGATAETSLKDKTLARCG